MDISFQKKRCLANLSCPPSRHAINGAAHLLPSSTPFPIPFPFPSFRHASVPVRLPCLVVATSPVPWCERWDCSVPKIEERTPPSTGWVLATKDAGHLPEAGGARAGGAEQPARGGVQAAPPRRDPARLPRRAPAGRLLSLLRRRRRARLHLPQDVLRPRRHLLRLPGPPRQPQHAHPPVRPLHQVHQRGAARHRGLPHAPRPRAVPRRPGRQGPRRALRLRRLRQQVRRSLRGTELRGQGRAPVLGHRGGRLRGHQRRPGHRQARVRQVLRALPRRMHVPQRGRAQELRAPHEPAQAHAPRRQRGRHVRRNLQGRHLHQDQLHAARRQRHQLGRRMGRHGHLIS